MLLEMLIAQACVGIHGMERDACIKALQAASIQYNIQEPVKKTERATRDIVQRKVESITGKEVLAVGLFTAKVMRDKEVSANLVREKGKMPSVNMSAGQTSGKVTFSWGF
jgi:hypothetical protein